VGRSGGKKLLGPGDLKAIDMGSKRQIIARDGKLGGGTPNEKKLALNARGKNFSGHTKWIAKNCGKKWHQTLEVWTKFQKKRKKKYRLFKTQTQKVMGGRIPKRNKGTKGRDWKSEAFEGGMTQTRGSSREPSE